MRQCNAVRTMEEAVRLAQEIKRQIWEQTQLTASAGISYCKFLAKIASDAHKPDGLTVIPQEEASAFLEALPIEKFFGVGKVTAAKLSELGIQTGADLKHMGEERLRELLGKHGGQLYHYACGMDDRPVEPVRERKSVGKEVTLERDIRNRSEMERILEALSLQVERRLAELGIAGKTLTLKVRWSTFELVTRATSRVQGFQSAQEITCAERGSSLLQGSSLVSCLAARSRVEGGERDTALPLAGMYELFERTRATKHMVILRRADHGHFGDEVEHQADLCSREQAQPCLFLTRDEKSLCLRETQAE